MAGQLLITGSDGFTGRHLVYAARAAGYEVHALEADIANAPDVAMELAGRSFDYIIHLAGISAVTHHDELAFYRVNVLGSLNLSEAILGLAQVPRTVIYASSATVYGNSETASLNESSTLAPTNHYAVSKLAMEHLARTYQSKFPLIITRPFNYTGVGHDSRFVIPKLVKHFRQKKAQIELGNLNVEREFNDVRDVCDWYLQLLSSGVASQTYNLCTGRTHSLAEIISILETQSSHTIDVRVNPAFVRDNEVHKLCGNPEKLLGAIGYPSTKSIEETLQWMLDAQV